MAIDFARNRPTEVYLLYYGVGRKDRKKQGRKEVALPSKQGISVRAFLARSLSVKKTKVNDVRHRRLGQLDRLNKSYWEESRLDAAARRPINKTPIPRSSNLWTHIQPPSWLAFFAEIQTKPEA